MKGNQRLALGVDCGGTNLKVALVKESGEIIQSAIFPVEFKDAPENVVRGIAKKIKSFLKNSKVKKIEGLGMGIAGDVEPDNGLVRFSPNLNWKNVPLKKIISSEFNMPVLIENDANCAAWGAYCLDAKKDCENLICLTLGTGVGGGIVINRKLYRGSTGSAGEMGHMTIQYNGRLCACGNFGCLEGLIGTAGLVSVAEEGLKRNLAPVLRDILSKSKIKKIEPKTISMAASRGDTYCIQLWKDAGEHLGCGLTTLVNIFNPDRIVLCGGVSKVGSLLLEPALHTLGMRAFQTAVRKVKVTISQFDDRLGVVGAALLFWE